MTGHATLDADHRDAGSSLSRGSRTWPPRLPVALAIAVLCSVLNAACANATRSMGAAAPQGPEATLDPGSAQTADELAARGAFQDERPSPWRAGVLRGFWGRPPETGLNYLPSGLHTTSTRLGTFQLVGGVYHSVNGSTFINSHGNRTWAIALERNAFRYHRLHLGYIAGLMAGYHGDLVETKVPFRHSFLFTHNINPVLGAPVYVDVSRHIQAQVFVTPFVILAGVKVVLSR